MGLNRCIKRPCNIRLPYIIYIIRLNGYETCSTEQSRGIRFYGDYVSSNRLALSTFLTMLVVAHGEAQAAKTVAVDT